uniref:Uncharacterized protein n=1 Tax=Arundo donax TaxID=35708 RepID=A0A0A9CBK1_ARUDO
MNKKTTSDCLCRKEKNCANYIINVC